MQELSLEKVTTRLLELYAVVLTRWHDSARV